MVLVVQVLRVTWGVWRCGGRVVNRVLGSADHVGGDMRL